MCPDTTIPVVAAAEFSGQSERRHGGRTPTFFHCSIPAWIPARC